MARAPGQALADFAIFKLVAEYWGCGAMFRAWESPAAAFQVLKRLSAGQPCDITGIADYEMLDANGGIQWPFPAGECPPRRGARSGASSRTAATTTPTGAPGSSTRTRVRSGAPNERFRCCC